jgi:hypothetical protein
LLAWLKAQAERYCGGPVQIASIYEAGLDGFCVHRLLEANGVESHVVDAASIAVDRRSRRAKTERIDVEKLLRTLMGWARGERRICWMVRPLSPIDEDERPAGIRHCHPCSRLTSSRDTARVAPIANRRSQCFRALKEERCNERVVANASQQSLGQVVIDAEASVLDVAAQCIPSAQRILERLSEGRLSGQPSAAAEAQRIDRRRHRA